MPVGAPVIGILDNGPVFGCAGVFHHHRFGIIAGIRQYPVGAVAVLHDFKALGNHLAVELRRPNLDRRIVVGGIALDLYRRKGGAHRNKRVILSGGIIGDVKLLIVTAAEAALGQIRAVCAARDSEIFPAVGVAKAIDSAAYNPGSLTRRIGFVGNRDNGPQGGIGGIVAADITHPVHGGFQLTGLEPDAVIAGRTGVPRLDPGRDVKRITTAGLSTAVFNG